MEEVGSRLRSNGKYAEQVHLKLRWQGFKTITRQKMLATACCDDFNFREAAMVLFHAEKLERPVRLIGFGLSRFSVGQSQQLDLFDDHRVEKERRENLSRAVDSIRHDLGKSAIHRGSSEGEAPPAAHC